MSRCQYEVPHDIAQIVAEHKDPKTIAEMATPLAEHRRPTKEEAGNKPNDIRFKAYGTSKEYRAARLARDAPEVWHERPLYR